MKNEARSSAIHGDLWIQGWTPFLLNQGRKTLIGANEDRVFFTVDVAESKLDCVQRSERALSAMRAKYSRCFLDYER